jgi:hypothetical protein
MRAPADAAFAARGRAKAAKAQRRGKGNASPGGENSPFRKFVAPSGLQVRSAFGWKLSKCCTCSFWPARTCALCSLEAAA